MIQWNFIGPKNIYFLLLFNVFDVDSFHLLIVNVLKVFFFFTYIEFHGIIFYIVVISNDFLSLSDHQMVSDHYISYIICLTSMYWWGWADSGGGTNHGPLSLPRIHNQLDFDIFMHRGIQPRDPLPPVEII